MDLGKLPPIIAHVKALIPTLSPRPVLLLSGGPHLLREKKTTTQTYMDFKFTSDPNFLNPVPHAAHEYVRGTGSLYLLNLLRGRGLVSLRRRYLRTVSRVTDLEFNSSPRIFE